MARLFVFLTGIFRKKHNAAWLKRSIESESAGRVVKKLERAASSGSQGSALACRAFIPIGAPILADPHSSFNLAPNPHSVSARLANGSFDTRTWTRNGVLAPTPAITRNTS